jgi:serine/threonine protein kinase
MVPAVPTSSQKFGNYEIVKKLGHGGMGVVYLGKDPRLNRFVAIKSLLVEDSTGEKSKRFFREANAMARLHHPNVIQVYDIGQEGNTPFFVMEFIEGQTLDKKIPIQGMPVGEALQLMATVADTIGYIHEQKIIHRDLKPANIMIDKNNNIKVMDFGLTKASEGSKLSQDGLAVGTLGYIAPEQYDGNAEERSDVYALGIILYQLLTGVLPFEGESLSSVLWKQLQAPAIPPSQRNPEIPKDVDTIVLRAFEYDKEHRYASAKNMATDIRRYLNGESLMAHPVRFHERLCRTCRRSPKVSALMAGCLILAGLGLATLLMPHASLSDLLKEQEQMVARLKEMPQHQAERNLAGLTSLLQHPKQDEAMRAQTYFLRAQFYEYQSKYREASLDYTLAAKTRWERDKEAEARATVCKYRPLKKNIQTQVGKMPGMSKQELEQLAKECGAILQYHPELAGRLSGKELAVQTRLLRAAAYQKMGQTELEQQDRACVEAMFDSACKSDETIAIAEMIIESALQQDDWKTAKVYFSRAYGKIHKELGQHPKEFAPIAKKFLAFIPRLIQQDYRLADSWLGNIEPYFLGDIKNHTILKYYVRVIYFADHCLGKTPEKSWNISRMGWLELANPQSDDRYASPAHMFLACLYWQKELTDMAQKSLQTAKQKRFRFANHEECKLLEQDVKFKEFLHSPEWADFWKKE